MQQLPKFYVNPFIRFRVWGTNTVQCFFKTKVKNQPNRENDSL